MDQQHDWFPHVGQQFDVFPPAWRAGLAVGLGMEYARSVAEFCRDCFVRLGGSAGRTTGVKCPDKPYGFPTVPLAVRPTDR